MDYSDCSEAVRRFTNGKEMRNGTNGRPRKREQAGVRMRAPKRKRIRMKFEGVERHIHIKMLIELFGPLLYPTSFKYCMLGMFGFFFFQHLYQKTVCYQMDR